MLVVLLQLLQLAVLTGSSLSQHLSPVGLEEGSHIVTSIAYM